MTLIGSSFFYGKKISNIHELPKNKLIILGKENKIIIWQSRTSGGINSLNRGKIFP